ncbi:hypothetical protein [Flavobacterium limnophilum]|uniref:hypothetical protein n=1 Tax=Flavobacterium limnophilum TaxID=3003262 RepID=UPI00248223AD|nr:hypothetical protein [Flavobacterium limnophilum]
MKKILGILGVTVMAVTMFLSTNNTNGASSDVNLAGLIGINNANAENCDDYQYVTESDVTTTSIVYDYKGRRCTEHTSQHVVDCEGFGPIVCPHTQTIALIWYDC